MTVNEIIWLVLCAFLVFFMQAGFAMLEVGMVRAKSAQSILIKNVIDLCVATIMWWLIGYGIAFGSDWGGFIGTTEFAQPNNTASWLFQFSFSATSATIVSGALAERTDLLAYISFTAFMTIFIYPLFVHWVWGNGWLQNIGFYDFAGSSVVHTTGGIAALIGAMFLGPRKGRFTHPEEFKPHNVPLVVLGMFILWMGWYGFNAGSIRNFNINYHLVGNVCINTSLSGAVSGLSSLILNKVTSKIPFNITSLINGILGGMVAITGCSPETPNYIAFIIGIFAGLFTELASKGIKKLKIDDPLDAFAIHGVCGIWGTIAVGFFDYSRGLFFGYGGSQLGYQILGLIINFIWVGCLSALVFFILKKINWLRIDEDIEVVGVDQCEHGGKAYQTDIELQADENNIPSDLIEDEI